MGRWIWNELYGFKHYIYSDKELVSCECCPMEPDICRSCQNKLKGVYYVQPKLNIKED